MFQNINLEDLLEKIEKGHYDNLHCKYEGTDWKIINLVISLKIQEVFNIRKYFQDISYNALMRELQGEDEKKLLHFKGFLNFVYGLIVKRTGVTYSIDRYLLNEDYIPKELIEQHEQIDKTDIYNSNDKIVEIYKKATDYFYQTGNHLGCMVKSGTRGNFYNIGNAFISFGYRIDSDSIVRPDYCNENLINGLKTTKSLYNSAISSRNALLQAVESIPDSGYIYRKLSLLLKEVEVVDKDFCGTTHTETIELDEGNRKFFIGRNINHNGEIVNLNKDNIGNYYGNINLYSPMTCDEKGYKVCKCCVGDYSNKVLKYGNNGIFSGMKFSEQITQSLLGTKHLQFVIFNKLHDKLKELIKYDNNRKAFIAIKDFELTNEVYNILVEEVIPFESYSLILEESEVGMTIQKNETVYVIESDRILNKDMNSILTELKGLMELYNLDLHSSYSSLNEDQEKSYFKTFIEFLNKNGIILDSVHIEFMIMCMTRQTHNPSLLWKDDKESHYIVLGLSKALLHSANIFDVLLFERIKNTLKNYTIVTEENEMESTLENLFNLG